jgi:hypothetical protein
MLLRRPQSDVPKQRQALEEWCKSLKKNLCYIAYSSLPRSFVDRRSNLSRPLYPCLVVNLPAENIAA